MERKGKRGFGRGLIFCASAGLLAGVLAGCTIGPKEADAQGEKRIETFSISPTTLVILADTQPALTVQDGATTYTLQSNASINFQPSGGAQLQQQSFALVAGDVVIERPAIGSLTLVRSPR